MVRRVYRSVMKRKLYGSKYSYWMSRCMRNMSYAAMRRALKRSSEYRRRFGRVRRVRRTPNLQPRILFSSRYSTTSTRRGMNWRRVRNIFRRASRRRGYCRRRVSSFTNLKNGNQCRGPNRNIAYEYKVNFWVPVRSRWRFRLGSDFGKGGVGVLDGKLVANGVGKNLWWAHRWSSKSVLTTGWRWLSRGRHHLSWWGAENCCDGSASMQYMRYGQGWRAVSTANLLRETTRGARKRYSRWIRAKVRDWRGRWRTVRLRPSSKKTTKRSRRFRVTKRCRFPRDVGGVQTNSRGQVRAWYRDRCAKRTKYGLWVGSGGRSYARWSRYTVITRVLPGYRPRLIRAKLVDWRGKKHRVKVRAGQRLLVRHSRKYKKSKRCPVSRDMAGIQASRRGTHVRAWYRDRCAKKTKYGRWVRPPRTSQARWGRYKVSARPYNRCGGRCRFLRRMAKSKRLRALGLRRLYLRRLARSRALRRRLRLSRRRLRRIKRMRNLRKYLKRMRAAMKRAMRRRRRRRGKGRRNRRRRVR